MFGKPRCDPTGLWTDGALANQIGLAGIRASKDTVRLFLVWRCYSIWRWFSECINGSIFVIIKCWAGNLYGVRARTSWYHTKKGWERTPRGLWPVISAFIRRTWSSLVLHLSNTVKWPHMEWPNAMVTSMILGKSIPSCKEISFEWIFSVVFPFCFCSFILDV